MTAIYSPAADRIAELVRIGSMVDAYDRSHANPTASQWHLVVGHGGEIPEAGLSLICQVAQSRPSWVNPAVVDLSDPLAVELFKLALSLSEATKVRSGDAVPAVVAPDCAPGEGERVEGAMVTDSRAIRLAELRQEQAEVLMLFHLLTPHLASDRDALMARYTQLEEEVLALSGELGKG